MSKKELENIKGAAVIAWLIFIGLWLIIIGINIIWFDASKQESIFVLSIVLLVTTCVNIIPFTYAAHKLDRE